jgi:hypothetical protein
MTGGHSGSQSDYGRALLANPGLPADHPRQVAHELLTAVGIGFVFYGPADATACFEEFARLAPALRESDGHNGSSFLAALRRRPGVFWFCFQGPRGSAIALCLTQEADTGFTANHIAMPLKNTQLPWEWGICTGGGSVTIACARIIDTAQIVELHTLPGLQHIPAANGQLPTDLLAGLVALGWQSAGDGLKTDVALVGGGAQSVFVFPRGSQSVDVVTQIGNTVNGVVPEGLRARAEGPYTVEAADDLVVMCQQFAIDDPNVSPASIDASARVLVTFAVAPHITLATETTPPEPTPAPVVQAPSHLPPSGPTTHVPSPAASRATNFPPPITNTDPYQSPSTLPRTAPAAFTPPPTTARAGGMNNRTVIVAAAAVIIAIVAAIAIFKNGDTRSTDRYTNDTAAGAGGTSGTVIPTPTRTTTADPASRLAELAAEDSAYIDGHLLDMWEPQLSSKRPGLVAEGITWSASDILREHMELRQRFPDARLVWSGDWPVYGDPTWWVTLAGIPFSSGEQANRWCEDQNFDADHCLAKLMSHTKGPNGTTLNRK